MQQPFLSRHARHTAAGSHDAAAGSRHAAEGSRDAAAGTRHAAAEILPGAIDVTPAQRDDGGGASTWALLVAVAQAAVADGGIAPEKLALDPTGWEMLAGEAEASRLAPLAWQALSPWRAAMPSTAVRQLEALALRHRAWHRARSAAVRALLAAMDRQAIDTVLLKGAALAWMIYPEPSLRPMSDVDLLVPPAQARAAQTVLATLGFRLDRRRAFGRTAHHLPIARLAADGLPISVEIHVDALSRDTGESIAMDRLTEPPRTLLVDAMPARALGHVDMLHHLARHLLEPAWDRRVRLIGLVDLLRYAARFDEEIDWGRIANERPFILNALACVDGLIPLPGALARFAPAERATMPRGAGEIIRPMRAMWRPRRPDVMLRELLDPPAWWLHAYYGVAPGRSLTDLRLRRHPSRVVRWLVLRAMGL